MSNEDKYRWHDLRENPYDVPEADTFTKGFSRDVLAVGVIGTYFIVNYWYDKKQWCERLSTSPVNIIAWKYIEPFEQ